jgi:hypothetical protein
MSSFYDTVGKQKVFEDLSARKNDLVLEFEVCLSQCHTGLVGERWLEICKDDERMITYNVHGGDIAERYLTIERPSSSSPES